MPLKHTATIEIGGESVAIDIQPPGEIETVDIPRPPAPKFASVGHCIYCGSVEDLSDEHVVPYGLSGDIVLPKASCAACARLTCQFEQLVLRGPMRAARVIRRLKSRTRHAGASTQRLVLVRQGGEVASIDLPLQDYPALLHFPVFTQPGCFTGRTDPGIVIQGIQTIRFGPSPEVVAKAHGARELRFPTNKERPTEFARMIAKIAYGIAHGAGQLPRLVNPLQVVPAILGRTDDIGRWVFTDSAKTITYPGFLHRIALHELNGHLIAEIHLFADSDSPRYGVVLGQLKQ